MQEHSIKNSILKSAKSFFYLTPMILGIILAIGFFQAFVTEEMLTSIFSGNPFVDTLLGTVLGGVSVGQPVASYIIGGELKDGGVSMYAVTAFILAWVTLGIVQLPLEVALFGRRFALVRNLLGFLFVLLISAATVETLRFLA